uniref:Uncharacterized protein n=1 Tax=Myotis myotis TaxID=51298 RepID=A0A7J7U5D0_MYOMY|nr:hypothetical protein mMyoMyo1_008815 [Myotis myotis]
MKPTKRAAPAAPSWRRMQRNPQGQQPAPPDACKLRLQRSTPPHSWLPFLQVAPPHTGRQAPGQSTDLTWLRSKGFGGGVAKSWVCSCVSPRDSPSPHPPEPPERGGGRAGWGSSGRGAACPPPSPGGWAGGPGCSQPSWVCHTPGM